MIPYSNNAQIVTFLNRAQNKIASLGSLLVERGGDVPTAEYILLELSDFIECLDNEFNTWTEEYILKCIDGYNQRADLNSIPFLLLTSFNQSIVTGGGSFGLPITTADVSDYIPATNTLIINTPHNNLKSIQPISSYLGYVAGERYHLSKEMYDWVYNQIHPFTAPTTQLTIAPFNYREKGTVVSSVNLIGSFILNGGGSLVAYRYKRLGRVPSDILQTIVSSSIAPYNMVEDVRVNTTFRLEADFQAGGTINAEQTLRFIAPMWYGVALKGSSVVAIQGLTKVVEEPINPKTFSFTLPSNNTVVPSNEIQTAYILVSKTKGIPSNFSIQTFNTLPSWTVTSVSVLLQDGTTELCWLCEFKNTVIGTFDCTVTWS